MGSPTATPVVDVVILTCNDGALLRTAIESVLRSESVITNVVVVDNGSADPAEVSDLVTLIRLEENRGVAAGRNIGIRSGSADLVCVLDSDAELGPWSLWNLCEELTRTAAAVAVPCFVDQKPTASAGAAPTLGDKVRRVMGKTNEYRPQGSHPNGSSWAVDFGIGACQLFRREVYEEVGGIDESFFYGPEDVDFCLRIKQAGHDVVQVSGHEVLHPPRRIHRKPITRRGLAHAWAVTRYYSRHRGWIMAQTKDAGR